MRQLTEGLASPWLTERDVRICHNHPPVRDSQQFNPAERRKSLYVNTAVGADCMQRNRVYFDFPALDGRPPVKLTWYDGNKTPKTVADERVPGMGVMFVGSKGKIKVAFVHVAAQAEAEKINKYVLRAAQEFSDLARRLLK